MSTEISSLLVSSSDVCGGRMHIEGTGITVNEIVVLYKQGFNADGIADRYPQLTMAQVFAALAYYHANEEEIEVDLEAETKEVHSESNAPTGSLEKEVRLNAFHALQRSLNLTPARATEWQDAVREARR